MREIHSFEVFEKAILECAEPKFGYRIEVSERLHAPKVNCPELGVVVQGRVPDRPTARRERLRPIGGVP
jgi:hypothetical protein